MDRPILFSGPMVRALLDGRKTQTRRIVRIPAWFEEEYSRYDDYELRKELDCPYGSPGDRLWCRETHAIVPRTAYWHDRSIPHVERADEWAVYREGWERTAPSRWRSSIHMPRWASRITLEVTEVRVQRLQDISEEDARAESVERSHPLTGIDQLDAAHSARSNFWTLWATINGDRPPKSWGSNPWVWAISFRRLP